jgi:hypothetical protein
VPPVAICRIDEGGGIKMPVVMVNEVANGAHLGGLRWISAVAGDAGRGAAY